MPLEKSGLCQIAPTHGLGLLARSCFSQLIWAEPASCAISEFREYMRQAPMFHA